MAAALPFPAITAEPKCLPQEPRSGLTTEVFQTVF